MKFIKAQKIATTEMLEVTKEELNELVGLNQFISISQHDKDHNLDKDGVVGYIAGDIKHIQMHEKDMKTTNGETPDSWFINKDFFNDNYKEI